MTARRSKKKPKTWDLAQKLRLVMANEGMNQRSFAEHIGVSPTTLSSWLSGTLPGAKNLDQIAKKTGLPAEYWLDEKVPYPPPADYLNTVDDLEGLLRGMTVEELTKWIRILSDPEARARTLALWEASQVGR